MVRARAQRRGAGRARRVVGRFAQRSSMRVAAPAGARRGCSRVASRRIRVAGARLRARARRVRNAAWPCAR